MGCHSLCVLRTTALVCGPLKDDKPPPVLSMKDLTSSLVAVQYHIVAKQTLGTSKRLIACDPYAMYVIGY